MARVLLASDNWRLQLGRLLTRMQDGDTLVLPPAVPRQEVDAILRQHYADLLIFIEQARPPPQPTA